MGWYRRALSLASALARAFGFGLVVGRATETDDDQQKRRINNWIIFLKCQLVDIFVAMNYDRFEISTTSNQTRASSFLVAGVEIVSNTDSDFRWFLYLALEI